MVYGGNDINFFSINFFKSGKNYRAIILDLIFKGNSLHLSAKKIQEAFSLGREFV